MRPVVFALDHACSITEAPAETPHENWFQQTYGDAIVSALERLRNPTNPANPASSWLPFKQVCVWVFLCIWIIINFTGIHLQTCQHFFCTQCAFWPLSTLVRIAALAVSMQVQKKFIKFPQGWQVCICMYVSLWVFTDEFFLYIMNMVNMHSKQYKCAGLNKWCVCWSDHDELAAACSEASQLSSSLGWDQSSPGVNDHNRDGPARRGVCIRCCHNRECR